MDELDPVFSTVASYFGVLSEPTRLKIMHALCLGEKSVSQIVAETGATQTNVSRHLGLMHRHGMVARRKEGTTSWYTITDPQVFTMCELVCGGLEEEIDRKKQLLRRRR